ncbi:MAG: VOC family protein [Acidimicrobiales bacterium]
MPDPFDQLRSAVAPETPDPAFVARLRQRIARAVQSEETGPPETGPRETRRGATVTELVLEERPPPAAVRSVLTPYLAVRGAREAVDFYREAFGASLRGEPVVMADGRVGHAELDLAGAVLMLAEEHPAIGFTAPEPVDGTPVTLHLEVADVDAVLLRAVRAGARLERAAADHEHGRNGVVRDPFGHRWMIAAAVATPTLRHGDLGYVSLWVPDGDRAAAFFSAVLGWRYRGGGTAGARLVDGLSLSHGLVGGRGPTLYCCYAVADVPAAVEAVRAAGGTAGRPERRPYGLVVECVDDQGVDFALFEPPEGIAEDGGAPAPPARGDLAYVTMEVVDSARARAFYGAVLGWHFVPGTVDDGWQVHDVRPSVGMAGGRPAPVTVPMYRVDDIGAAVEAVRRAGGTATDPERQPYGVTAACADDQGTRFSLGQLAD